MSYITDMPQQYRLSKIQKLTVATEVLDAFELLPLSRSAAIGQAILAAGKRPELIPLALRERMSQTRSGNNVRVSYTRENRLDAMIKRLAEMTDLSGEQVVRLCMEAYLYKL